MGKFIHTLNIFFKKAVAHWDVLIAAFRHKCISKFQESKQVAEKIAAIYRRQ